MTPRRYDLLALDLDGTLLDPLGKVSEANRAAVLRARDAGMKIVVCTGRGLVECRYALEAIEQREPVVVAGGAIIADPVGGRTVQRFGIELPLVKLTVEAMLAHEYPALVLKDPGEAGYDYLIVGAHRYPLDPVSQWWFAEMGIALRYVRELERDPHPDHTVRVGACGSAERMAKVKADLIAGLKDSAIVHHFPAVVAPDQVKKGEYGTLHILEVFEKRANKWDAVMHLARQYGIEAARIAAIGDEVNDLAMISRAGLGIAMGNAVPAVREIAKRATTANTADGVAFALERILSGEW